MLQCHYACHKYTYKYLQSTHILAKRLYQNLQKSLKIKMLQAELILLMKLYYSLNLGIAVGS